jgi:DNA helicase II / ATP-dependent DNA helicase PcrA
VDRESIFEGLNPEQRQAVEAVRGPVCILAGAGSGKTTTITRRIANQVVTGAFRPSEILAVTFTDKAATEMRERLARLGAAGVPARTFHAAALAQLRYFRGEEVGELLPSKAPLLLPLARSLPVPFRYRPLADLATEIEWAKNRRLTPSTYRRSLSGHEPPIPDDLMEHVFRSYEERKTARGRIDFEDLLELAVRMYDEDSTALAGFRERYRAFTVDEFQDVNLLQQELLDRWLGDRDELCVVGDDYQSIYSFTGASPEHLLRMPGRFHGTLVVRLESNYRSTPEILAFANRLVPGLGGSEKVLRTVLPSGPEPKVEPVVDRLAEAAQLAEEARRLHETEAVPWEEMAVLYRLNARSEDYEEALAHANIPYQVRGGAFLGRPAAQRTLRLLRGRPGVPAAPAVREVVDKQGRLERPPAGLGEEELTRQADLARLLLLAEQLGPEATVAAFLHDLEERFGVEARGRGVNLLTYHRAKGLEWEAVFLPRLEEKELPYGKALRGDRLAEERRLFYVGLTRAKRHLLLTWTADARPSRFLAELGVVGEARARPPKRESTPEFEALRAWRVRRAREDGIAPFIVFHDSVLHEIASRRPTTRAELSVIPGIGPAKLERYADDVLQALARMPQPA